MSNTTNLKLKNIVKFSINRKRLFLVMFILIFAVAILYAKFGKGDLFWLFENVPEDEFPILKEGAEIAIILAPISALALAIERILETFFDMIEQSVSNVAGLMDHGAEMADLIDKEIEKAGQEVEKHYRTWTSFKNSGEAFPTDKDGPKTENEAKDLLDKAENRLLEASTRLKNLTKDPRYTCTKRAFSIMGGLFLGFMVAIFLESGIFAYLQQSVPRILDIVVTGFVIGAGSGPMHSLVGILQGFKDSLEKFSRTTSKGTTGNQPAG